MDTGSNAIWADANNFDDFELSRPQLFREEMRDLFYNYFRIKPSHTILDGGCATGVLTRYIAKGLGTGTITGFDISQNFVDYGNSKIHEENLSRKAKIVLEDGYNLSFENNTFDAVTNHTYLGVLSDPVAGLKELIRVCKIGGSVSSSVSSTHFMGVEWQGEYNYDGADRLTELLTRQNIIYHKIFTPTFLKQSEYWHSKRYPKMFSECGLKNITIHPIASGFAYNDCYWSDEYKIKKITKGIQREISWYEKRKENPLFAEHGFSDENFDELIFLLKQKQKYLLKNLCDDDSWEWSASLSCIVTGTKII